MLVAAISFPFRQSSGVTKAQEKSILKMSFVPCDLASFIGFLDTPGARKFYDLIVVMEKYWAHLRLEKYIKEKLDEMNFVLLAIKDCRAVEVFIGRKLGETAKKSFGSGWFNFKIVVYFRNMDEHYNDFLTELEQASTVIYPQNPNRSICVNYAIGGVCEHKQEGGFDHPTDPKQCERTLAIIYPQQPGKSYCHMFMTTGDCQFRKKCRFHHPLHQLARRRNCPKKLKLDKCRITEKADALFGSACSLLRRAMEAAWIDGFSSGIEFKDELDSQVPF